MSGIFSAGSGWSSDCDDYFYGDLLSRELPEPDLSELPPTLSRSTPPPAVDLHDEIDHDVSVDELPRLSDSGIDSIVERCLSASELESSSTAASSSSSAASSGSSVEDFTAIEASLFDQLPHAEDDEGSSSIARSRSSVASSSSSAAAEVEELSSAKLVDLCQSFLAIAYDRQLHPEEDQQRLSMEMLYHCFFYRRESGQSFTKLDADLMIASLQAAFVLQDRSVWQGLVKYVRESGKFPLAAELTKAYEALWDRHSRLAQQILLRMLGLYGCSNEERLTRLRNPYRQYISSSEIERTVYAQTYFVLARIYSTQAHGAEMKERLAECAAQLGHPAADRWVSGRRCQWKRRLKEALEAHERFVEGERRLSPESSQSGGEDPAVNLLKTLLRHVESQRGTKAFSEELRTNLYRVYGEDRTRYALDPELTLTDLLTLSHEEFYHRLERAVTSTASRVLAGPELVRRLVELQGQLLHACLGHGPQLSDATGRFYLRALGSLSAFLTGQAEVRSVPELREKLERGAMTCAESRRRMRYQLRTDVLVLFSWLESLEHRGLVGIRQKYIKELVRLLASCSLGDSLEEMRARKDLSPHHRQRYIRICRHLCQVYADQSPTPANFARINRLCEAAFSAGCRQAELLRTMAERKRPFQCRFASLKKDLWQAYRCESEAAWRAAHRGIAELIVDLRSSGWCEFARHVQETSLFQ